MPIELTPSSALVSRNIMVHDKRTSIRLEPAFWEALSAIAQVEGKSVNQLCSHIATISKKSSSFTSAVRVYIISQLPIISEDVLLAAE